MPAHIENVIKCDGTRSLASVHMTPAQFENGRMINDNRFFHATDNQPNFESIETCSIFVIFKCSLDAVFQICRLELYFQSLPFTVQQEIGQLHVNGWPVCNNFNTIFKYAILNNIQNLAFSIYL